MKNLRNQVIISLLLEHEMHMRRAVRVTVQLGQQPPNGTIMGNGVWYRRNGLEPKYAALIRSHNTATIRLVSTRILHIIMASTIRLPDINLHIINRPTLHVLQCANHEQGFTLGIMRHGFTGWHLLRIVGMEGTQDGTFGGTGRLGVID